MVDVIDGKLELLFAHLSLNNVQHIRPLLMDAIDEYQNIRRSLSYDDKKRLNFIKNLLWHAERGEWAQARHKLTDAQKAYQDYIGKKMDIMKKPLGYSHIHGKQTLESSNPTDTTLQKYMFRSDEIPGQPSKAQRATLGLDSFRPRPVMSAPAPGDETGPLARISRTSGSVVEEQGPTHMRRGSMSRYTGIHQHGNEKRTDPMQQGLAVQAARTLGYHEAVDAEFKMDQESSRPTKISEAYWSVYKNEWRRALEAIKLTGISEEKGIGCLFYIIQEAFQFCLLEAKAQVLEFEAAALSILTEGRYSQVQRAHLAAHGNLKHMVRYRHEVADVAVSRLQEVFLTKILPLIHRKYSVRTRGAIDNYARQGVAVTWRMAIQEPPLHLEFQDKGSEGADFELTLYEPYMGAGRKVKYYVWPALRLYEGGPVLCRGVAHAEPHSVG